MASAWLAPNSADRALAERKISLILAQHCSIGFRSGEWAGYTEWLRRCDSSWTPGLLGRVVHDDHLTRQQAWTQHLFHIGQEDIAIGRFGMVMVAIAQNSSLP